MRKVSCIPLVLAAVLVALLLSPATKADDWDKKTIVTFEQDVEIPGQVLPAGTYVFKLLRSSSNRFITQIWDGDESLLLSTLITVGDSYPNPSGKPYFVLDMTGTDEGYPPLVVSWFFGGGDEGRDFIYSGYSTSQMVRDQYAPSAQPEQ
jgi:hypothetical protein